MVAIERNSICLHASDEAVPKPSMAHKNCRTKKITDITNEANVLIPYPSNCLEGSKAASNLYAWIQAPFAKRLLKNVSGDERLILIGVDENYNTEQFYSQSRVQELLACSANRIHIGFLHKAHLKYHSGAPSGRTQSVHQHRERGRDSNHPSEY